MVVMTEKKKTSRKKKTAPSAAPEQQSLLATEFGIQKLPAHITRMIPLATIIVPDEELVHPADIAEMARSIKEVGVIHQPSVVLLAGFSPTDDPDATFRVAVGRRRVLGARRAGLSEIECNVFLEPIDEGIGDLLTVVENNIRTSAWQKEVKALAHLLSVRPHITETELRTRLGIPAHVLKRYLPLVGLPVPLLAAITSGSVSQALASKLLRLSASRQEELANLVYAGEILSDELVEGYWKVQRDSGLSQITATEIFDENTEDEEGESDPIGVRQMLAEIEMRSEVKAAITCLVSLRSIAFPRRSILLLIESLIQELEAWQKQEGHEYD